MSQEKIRPRLLSPQEAEILARTVVQRVAVKGRIECYGLSWKSDALLKWEIDQRAMGLEPVVDVRIDELDLSVVYVEVPDRSVGPFRAISRQPSFTEGLSLYELNCLKERQKDADTGARLGRLEDADALDLRIQYHKELGHGDDPVALKRLADVRNEMARLRLLQAKPEGDDPPPPTPTAKKTAKPKNSGRKPKKVARPPDPPQGTSTPESKPETPAAPPANLSDGPNNTHPSPRKQGDAPTRKYQSIQLNRRSNEN